MQRIDEATVMLTTAAEKRAHAWFELQLDLGRPLVTAATECAAKFAVDSEFADWLIDGDGALGIDSQARMALPSTTTDGDDSPVVDRRDFASFTRREIAEIRRHGGRLTDRISRAVQAGQPTRLRCAPCDSYYCRHTS